jgi:hypothetical protein
VNARKPTGGTFPQFDPKVLNRAAQGIAEAMRGAAEAFEGMSRNLRLREALGVALNPNSAALDRALSALSEDEREALAKAAFRIRTRLDRMEKSP